MAVELLAPGGNYNSVIAAINAGADAVYTGGSLFGARANAENLTTDELLKAIDYAHLFGRKIYLTINTLIKDKEIEEKLFEYLLPFYEHGLDAVIVQDMGVLLFIRENFPKLHIHASTQMTIAGKLTVRELEEMGVSRIVTPRELSMEEIREIHKSTGVEIESFIHGALCYCYSGQCFLSSYIGGRSGNRGQCAQPCRMEYDVVKNGKILNPGNNKYVLSPKDICTLKILPDIIESGVYSLKIEGRMKKPEYVAGVVSIYRKYIDMYLENKERYFVDENDVKLLADLFNRNGFSQSYYYQHNGREMISLKKPEFRMENTDFIKKLKESYIEKTKKYLLDIKVSVIKNQPISATAKIGEKDITVYGDLPQSAENRSITREMVLKQMSKMGNTDFEIHTIEISLSEGVFVPVGSFNQLRRQLTECIKEYLLSGYRREMAVQKNYTKSVYNSSELSLNALVSDEKQIELLLNHDFISRIYIEEFALKQKNIVEIIHKIHASKKDVFLAMPYMFRAKNKKIFYEKMGSILEKFDGFLIRNIEQYYDLKKNQVEKKYVFDYNVYAYNSQAKDYYLRKGIETTVPLELNDNEMKKRGCEREEFIAYGYMPVMISAGCGLKTCGNCSRSDSLYEIRDRLKNTFPTKCVCDYCYNIMYNCKPLSLLKYGNEIKDLNIESIRLNFTWESAGQIKDILNQYIQVFFRNQKITDTTDSTRGHFKRGVL